MASCEIWVWQVKRGKSQRSKAAKDNFAIRGVNRLGGNEHEVHGLGLLGQGAFFESVKKLRGVNQANLLGERRIARVGEQCVDEFLVVGVARVDKDH